MSATAHASRAPSVATVDLIIAAVADTHDLGSLQYDNDDEIVCEKTDLPFDSLWLVPHGFI